MKTTTHYIFLAILFISLNSCESDSEISFTEVSGEIGFTGTNEDIIDFLTPEVYNVMLDLGLDINTGSTPQNITGVFLASPYCLISSTNPDTQGNCDFADFELTFLNQNSEDLQISYNSRQIDSDGNVIFSESGAGFISGDFDGNFTVIVKAISGDGSENATAFSGRISEEGIFNYQDIFVADISDTDNLSGALFSDEDGLAVRQ